MSSREYCLRVSCQVVKKSYGQLLALASFTGAQRWVFVRSRLVIIWRINKTKNSIESKKRINIWVGWNPLLLAISLFSAHISKCCNQFLSKKCRQRMSLNTMTLCDKKKDLYKMHICPVPLTVHHMLSCMTHDPVNYNFVRQSRGWVPKFATMLHSMLR